MVTKTGKGKVSDPLREATTLAIVRIIDPLLDLMFDAGVTVQELNQIVRERAVRNATRRVVRETGRESRARVAIATGVPRSEVAKILEHRDALSLKHREQQPARRVLAAWYQDNQFLNDKGEPADLPIFGKRGSFEQLVALHSGGTPVRAMLDELSRVGAIEFLGEQYIRPRTRVPLVAGLNTSAVTMVGERCADLLDTLLKNVRRVDPPLFEATAVVSDSDPQLRTVIQREVNQQATSFIHAINSLLNRSRVRSNKSRSAVQNKERVGVTVYFFHDEAKPNEDAAGGPPRRRTNLRRKAGKQPKNKSTD